MVLADSEDIQSYLIGVLDLLDQVSKTFRRADRTTGVIVRRREAVDSDLHYSLPRIHIVNSYSS